jgi:hypothetical protein
MASLPCSIYFAAQGSVPEAVNRSTLPYPAAPSSRQQRCRELPRSFARVDLPVELITHQFLRLSSLAPPTHAANIYHIFTSFDKVEVRARKFSWRLGRNSMVCCDTVALLVNSHSARASGRLRVIAPKDVVSTIWLLCIPSGAA